MHGVSGIFVTVRGQRYSLKVAPKIQLSPPSVTAPAQYLPSAFVPALKVSDFMANEVPLIVKARLTFVLGTRVLRCEFAVAGEPRDLRARVDKASVVGAVEGAGNLSVKRIVSGCWQHDLVGPAEPLRVSE